MTAVFLDTVGLLALWDVADQWHAGAEAAFRELRSRHVPLVTTTFVLLECGNAAARRPYRAEPEKLRKLLESRHELIVPTADDWRAAWESYSRGEIGGPGIVDCVSLAVMRRSSLTDVFSNDRHFTAAGLRTLF